MDEYHEWQHVYERIMLASHELAYRRARKWKATNDIVDEDGFIVLERITSKYKELLNIDDIKKKAELSRSQNKPVTGHVGITAEEYAEASKEFFRNSWL